MLSAEHQAVVSALGRLPRRQREVLVLRYYGGLSEAEIAETAGISPGTVKSTASRGVHALSQNPPRRATTRKQPPRGTAGRRIRYVGRHTVTGGWRARANRVRSNSRSTAALDRHELTGLGDTGTRRSPLGLGTPGRYLVEHKFDHSPRGLRWPDAPRGPRRHPRPPRCGVAPHAPVAALRRGRRRGSGRPARSRRPARPPRRAGPRRGRRARRRGRRRRWAPEDRPAGGGRQRGRGRPAPPRRVVGPAGTAPVRSARSRRCCARSAAAGVRCSAPLTATSPWPSAPGAPPTRPDRSAVLRTVRGCAPLGRARSGVSEPGATVGSVAGTRGDTAAGTTRQLLRWEVTPPPRPAAAARAAPCPGLVIEHVDGAAQWRVPRMPGQVRPVVVSLMRTSSSASQHSRTWARMPPSRRWRTERRSRFCFMSRQPRSTLASWR